MAQIDTASQRAMLEASLRDIGKITELSPDNKLSGPANWQSWSITMRDKFQAVGLGRIIKYKATDTVMAVPTDQTNLAYYIEVKERLIAVIFINISSDVRQSLNDDEYSDPQVLWDQLQLANRDKSLSNIMNIETDISDLKLHTRRREDVENHFKTFDRYLARLREAGSPWDAGRKATALAGSLDAEMWSGYRLRINDKHADGVTWPVLKQDVLNSMLAECPRNNTVTQAYVASSTFTGSDNLVGAVVAIKPKNLTPAQEVDWFVSLGKAVIKASIPAKKASGGWCTKCFKHGSKTPCRAQNSNKTTKIEVKEAVASADRVQSTSEDTSYSASTCWILDSGANRSIAKAKNAFTSLDSNAKHTIHLAGEGQSIQAEGAGAVKICPSEGPPLLLSDVLYAPQASDNLLSASDICKAGWEVRLNDNASELVKGSEAIPLARGNGHWLLQDEGGDFSSANYVKSSSSTPTSLFGVHERLGHVSISTIDKAVEMTTGIVITNRNEDAVHNCQVCNIVKSETQPLPKEGSRATEPLERVHIDLAGPFEDQKGFAFYFMIFTDNYSRYTQVRTIQRKTGENVLECMRHYRARLEKMTGKQIKSFFADNGKEFGNSLVQQYLRDSGIEMLNTMDYTSRQNLAERKIRSVKEIARSLLQRSGLRAEYYVFALKHAVYLMNRLPTRALDGITPVEALLGHKPDLSHLRTFGCLVYAHIPAEKITKSANDARRRRECYLLGIAETRKGYVMVDRFNGKIIFSKDVIFQEQPMVYPTEGDAEFLEGLTDFYPPLSGDAKADIVQPKVQLRAEGERVVPPASEPESGLSQPESESGDTVKQRAAPVRQQPRREATNKPRSEWKHPLKSLCADSRLNALEGEIVLCEAEKIVCLKVVTEENFYTPTTYFQAIQCDDALDWRAAMDAELAAIDQAGTWTPVDLPEGKKAIKCRWVFKGKTDADGFVNRFKARLVAKGFSQIPGIDFEDVYAPVARLTALRLFLSLTATQDLDLTQLDAKNAFLNGILKEEIYMQAPEGYPIESGKVLKLIKGLYGLKQAPRVWWERLDRELVQIGFKRISAEWGLYVLEDDGGDKAYLLVYVDDILLSTSPSSPLKDSIIKQLEASFEMTKTDSSTQILGLKLQRDRSKRVIKLNSPAYINGVLARFQMTDAHPIALPLQSGERLSKSGRALTSTTQQNYQALVGCLMWAMISCRPDICHAVGQLSRFGSDPKEEHWLAAKRVLRYLKGTCNHGIVLGGPNIAVLSGYSDATWGGDYEDPKSTSGYIFLFNGPISWASRKQRTVALSSTEAEYMALSDAAREAMYLRSVLAALTLKASPSDISATQQGNERMALFYDNAGAGKLAANPTEHQRTKHINIRYHYVRELLGKHITLSYVPTDKMPADIFTKPLPTPRFKEHLKAIGFVEC